MIDNNLTSMSKYCQMSAVKLLSRMVVGPLPLPGIPDTITRCAPVRALDIILGELGQMVQKNSQIYTAWDIKNG